MLKIRGLTKWFGTRRVLRDFSLDVARGERVALLGENGCGKSTLLRIVAGVLDAPEGRVEVAATLGYAPEEADLPDHLLAGEWLNLVASLKRAPWVDELGVAGFLGRKLGALSLGQRQRVSLVAAFTGNPPFVVLDEPTNALDEQTRARLERRIDRTTALLATHDRDFARRVATRIVTLPA